VADFPTLGGVSDSISNALGGVFGESFGGIFVPEAEKLHRQLTSVVARLKTTEKFIQVDAEAKLTLEQELATAREDDNQEQIDLLTRQMEAMERLQELMEDQDAQSYQEKVLDREALNAEQAAALITHMRQVSENMDVLQDRMEGSGADIVGAYRDTIMDQRVDNAHRMTMLQELVSNVKETGKSPEVVAQLERLSRQSNLTEAQLATVGSTLDGYQKHLQELGGIRDLQEQTQALLDNQDVDAGVRQQQLEQFISHLSTFDDFGSEVASLRDATKDGADLNREQLEEVRRVMDRVSDKTTEAKTLHSLRELNTNFDRAIMTNEQLSEGLTENKLQEKFKANPSLVAEGREMANTGMSLLLSQISPALGMVDQAFGGALSSMLEALLASAVGKIGSVVAAPFRGMANMVTSTVSGILSPVRDTATGAFSSLTAGVTNRVGMAMTAMKDKLARGVGSMVGHVQNGLGSLANSPMVTSAFDSIKNLGNKGMLKFGEMVGHVQGFASKGMTALGGLTSRVTSSIGSLVSSGTASLSGMAGQARTTFGSLTSSVTSTLGGLAAKGKASLAGLASSGRGSLGRLASKGVASLSGLASKGLDLLGSLKDKMGEPALPGGGGPLRKIGKMFGPVGKLLSKAAPLLSKAAPIAMAGMALVDGVSAISRSADIFGKAEGEKTSLGEDISAGLGGALSGFTMGFIGEDTLAKGIHGVGSAVSDAVSGIGNVLTFGLFSDDDGGKEDKKKKEKEVPKVEPKYVEPPSLLNRMSFGLFGDDGTTEEEAKAAKRKAIIPAQVDGVAPEEQKALVDTHMQSYISDAEVPAGVAGDQFKTNQLVYAERSNWVSEAESADLQPNLMAKRNFRAQMTSKVHGQWAPEQQTQESEVAQAEAKAVATVPAGAEEAPSILDKVLDVASMVSPIGIIGKGISGLFGKEDPAVVDQAVLGAEAQEQSLLSKVGSAVASLTPFGLISKGLGAIFGDDSAPDPVAAEAVAQRSASEASASASSLLDKTWDVVKSVSPIGFISSALGGLFGDDTTPVDSAVAGAQAKEASLLSKVGDAVSSINPFGLISKGLGAIFGDDSAPTPDETKAAVQSAADRAMSAGQSLLTATKNIVDSVPILSTISSGISSLFGGDASVASPVGVAPGATVPPQTIEQHMDQWVASAAVPNSVVQASENTHYSFVEAQRVQWVQEVTSAISAPSGEDLQMFRLKFLKRLRDLKTDWMKGRESEARSLAAEVSAPVESGFLAGLGNLWDSVASTAQNVIQVVAPKVQAAIPAITAATQKGLESVAPGVSQKIQSFTGIDQSTIKGTGGTPPVPSGAITSPSYAMPPTTMGGPGAASGGQSIPTGSAGSVRAPQEATRAVQEQKIGDATPKGPTAQGSTRPVVASAPRITAPTPPSTTTRVGPAPAKGGGGSPAPPKPPKPATPTIKLPSGPVPPSPATMAAAVGPAKPKEGGLWGALKSGASAVASGIGSLFFGTAEAASAPTTKGSAPAPGSAGSPTSQALPVVEPAAITTPAPTASSTVVPSGTPIQPPARSTKPKGQVTGGMAGVKAMIKQHEGLRLNVYNDSVGLPTIGYGHLLRPHEKHLRSISMPQADAMFETDFTHHKKAAERIPAFPQMSEAGQGGLIDLTFNMGPAWYKKWPNMMSQLKNEDYEGAANNLLDSKYARQVHGRANTVASLIRAGGDGSPSADSGPPPETSAAIGESVSAAVPTGGPPAGSGGGGAPTSPQVPEVPGAASPRAGGGAIPTGGAIINGSTVPAGLGLPSVRSGTQGESPGSRAGFPSVRRGRRGGKAAPARGRIRERQRPSVVSGVTQPAPNPSAVLAEATSANNLLMSEPRAKKEARVASGGPPRGGGGAAPAPTDARGGKGGGGSPEKKTSIDDPLLMLASMELF